MSKTCKICGNTMNNNLCEQCGWTEYLFTEKVPDVIKKFEEKRLQAMKNTYDNQKTTSALQQQLQREKEEVITLKNALDKVKEDKEIKAILVYPISNPSVAFPLKMGINNLGSKKMKPADGVQHIVFSTPFDSSIGYHQMDIKLFLNKEGDTKLQIRNVDQSHTLLVNQAEVGPSWRDINNNTLITVGDYELKLMKI